MEHPRAFSTLLLFGVLVPSAGLAAQGDPERTSELDTPPPAVARAALHFGSDSVTAAPGETYPRGAVGRFFLGDLHRDLWTIPFTLPILDMDSVGGGLEVVEVSGGKQTVGLRFRGRDGLLYQFRSIVKNASRALPEPLRETPVDEALQDAMASQFPLSAMVVAELLIAADVLVARPRPVIMPDHERLGEYREAFAGRMGWIEARPDEREGDRPGWEGSSKITGTDELYEEIREEPASFADARQLLKARLIDIFVGDWDRHSDQWRWASFEEKGGRLRWEPIPRDRDWALARIDGVLPWLVGVYLPRYVGFGPEYGPIVGMTWSGQRVDRTLLTPLAREDFLELATTLQAALDDEVLERAVGVLPPPYQEAVGAELLHAFRQRRDGLLDIAMEYYALLADRVDVHGTDEKDSVFVSAGEAGGMRVRAFSIEEDDQPPLLRYDRTFVPEETTEVRIYLWDDEDQVVVDSPDPLPMAVRVIGAGDDDRFVDNTDGRRLLIYDDEGGNELEVGEHAVVTDDALLVQDSIRTAYMLWDSRDWGSTSVPRPEARFDSDIGLFLGAGFARYGFGWGFRPYRTKASLSVLNGLDGGQWIVDAELDRPLGHRGWRVLGSFDAFTERPTWLFGFGNTVEPPGDADMFRSLRSEVTGALSLQFRADTSWMGFVGVELSRLSAVEPGSPVFDELAPYGSGDFVQAGLRFGARADTRDSHSMPTSGLVAELRGSIFPEGFDVEDAFGNAHAEIGGMFSADLPGDPALTLRLIGEQVWGRAPFHELAALGGSSSLPGYVRQRFIGRSAASATGLLRLRLAETGLVTDLDWGVHGIGTAGRVWLEDDTSDRWHEGWGGGLWTRIHSLDRVASVTFVSGDDLRAYLDFGFIF